MKKTIFVITLLFLITAISAQESFGQYYSEIDKKDLNNNDIKLSKLLEKGPVMISFWATWCAPCKEEMKKMQPIFEKYKDQGFTYIAISQDNQKSISKVKSFVNANKYTFPVILDLDKHIFENYSGVAIPYSILISQDKQIISKHLGFITGDEVKIEKEIKDALSGNDAKDIKEESK